MRSTGLLKTLSKLKVSKNMFFLIIFVVLNIDLTFCQYKTERPFNDFLNYGIKKLKPSRGLENEILKSKVEVLGDVLKNHVDRLRKIPGQTVELVFLVDSSASVGAENFFNELKFVKKLLADFTVSYNQTRVAVVTFSSKTKVIRHIDHVTQASFENHKCSLLERELPHIRYSGGGTFTLGAMLEAQSVLAVSRPDAVKAVFLVTDGYSNGGDPRQAAEFLKSRGVIIFTFGIQNGNVKELFDMASEPKEEHSYILNSFEEFEALARRALHEDLHSGMMIAQDAAACSTLCEERDNCCDDYARCTCGTHTGHYACTCRLGYYGTGLRGDCQPCPPGTYRDVEGPSDITGCKACPDPNMLGPEGATSPNQCFCNRGYTQHRLQCQRLQCPPLSPPANGHFVRDSCERVVNAACGIRCRAGYQLNGSSIRLCMEDGSWSGGDATCQVKTCPPSTPPKNGNMICSSETGTIDTQCHFTCKPGYQLVGSRMRTCLPVAMWDGIKAYCKPIFCTPLSPIKNGIIKPESCTIGKIKYGTRCEFGCDAGFQLSGPLKTTCIDQGVWSEGQQKARCVDVDPPSIQCPENVVATTEPHENYANVEWPTPISKDSSNTEVYLSTIPATKQPMKLKIGTHKITYVAKDEWGNKAKCAFHVEVTDDEPPTVDRCESPPTFLSREDEVDVYWEEPIFSDNSGGKVAVTRSQEPGRFRQGETAVEYTATDQYGNKASCNITISVQHHACDLPMDPINGVANCSENPEAVYCTLTCTDGYAFAMRPSQDYFCAYDGVWLPENNPLPFPECSVTSLSNTISQSGEIAMDEGVSVCDDIFFMGQVENQLQKKLEDTLSSVCADDLLCEIATVEAVCESLMAEMEEEFNSISYNRKKRMIDEESFFSQYWPLDDDSSGWTYWRRGTPTESNPTRSKRSPMSFHSNKARQKNQFGFPSGLFESMNANATHDLTKKNENNANFMGVLTGLIIQSLGKDIGMTRFSSFLSSLGSNEGNFRVEDFIAAFAKEFGEEKTKELRLLAEARFGHITNNTELNPQKNLQFPLLSDVPISQTGSTNLTETLSVPFLHETFKMEKLMLVPQKELIQNDYKTDGSAFPILFPGETLDQVNAEKSSTKKGLKIKFKVEGQGENVADKLSLAMKNILKSAGDGLFDIDYGERQIKVAAIRLSEDPEFICDPGSVLQDNLCVKCPVGAFFNVIAKNCQPCPEGSYQPQEGKVSCLVCPENTSTKNVQAKSNNDCKAMCLPGSYSNDTLEPCTTCSLGEYQDEYASNECAVCPFGTTTWRRGAWSAEECKPPCPAGEVSETGLKPCLPCPKDYFQPDEGKTQCLKCPGSSFTKTVGSQSLYGCEGVAENSEMAAFTSFETLNVNDCFSGPCRNNGKCSPLESGYICECILGYIGQQCETEVNECQNEPCLNNGSCSDLLGTFKCHCASGFRGDLCEQNINECDPNPCLNNASCVDLVDSFTCICESGFTGEVCDVNTDECEANPCAAGSTCIDGISDYTCNCQAGFTGRHCNTDIDDCDSSPCIHGTCSDLVNDYQCVCQPGYTSKQCNIDIDDCAGLPCTNNGTCTDWLNGFSCNCLPGFTGKLCETKMSTDFVLEFSSSETVNYASLENLPRPLSAVTVCFWMLTKDQKNYGTPFSYATKSHDNALTLTDYAGFVLYVNGEKRITDVSANDGHWHMICVLWDSRDGDWSIHKDGFKVDSGSGLSPGKIITADGVMVLGQEQDQRGGKYSVPESFIGEMTLFNVWSEILPEKELYQHFSECGRYDGNIHSWPDFQSGVMGNVKLKSSTFCRGCGVPYSPKHGSITEVGSESGSTVKVKCDDGYKIYLGDEVRTCLVNGKWSGEEPECKGVSCGFPGLLRNGDIRGFSYDFGDELIFSCNKGYRLFGDVKRTCQADGKWSGEEAQCEVIKCPTPAPMENGKLISHLGSYLPTNKVTFSCQEGYQMDGPASRSCGLDGNWDGEKSTCQPESCGSLPSISHGILSGVSVATSESVVVHCELGYKLKGKSEILCKDDGQWEHPLPKCVKGDCEKPPVVENGNVKLRVSTSGKEAKYSCDSGFVLDGPKLLICQDDGEWSHTFPQCILQPCPTPDVPLNAKIPNKARWSVGDQVVYECLPGYIMTGNNKKICKEDVDEGYWEGEAPVCAVAKCREPLEITGGKFKVKNTSPMIDNTNSNLEVNSEVELIRLRRNALDLEFPIIGQDGAEYEDFGQKQGEYEDFGQKQGEYEDFGQTQSGFDDFGQTQGGSDYGEFQSTLKTGGLEIGQSEDGLDVFSQTSDGFNFDYEQKPDTLIIETYLYNTTVEYECKPGFKLIGIPTLRCAENGDWDHPEPRCYEMHCPDLKSLEHGFVTYYGSGANSRVEYHCKDGFLLVGNKEIICQTDRTWSGKAPVCKQMKCINPVEPKNGTVTYTSVQFGSVATYDCLQGFVLEGSFERHCGINGFWNGSQPRCIGIVCKTPSVIDKGYIYYEGNLDVGSVVEYGCNDCYKLVGTAKRECELDGTWSLEEPLCELIECDIIPSELKNGRISGEENSCGSLVEYECDPGYKIIGKTRASCQENGKWTSPVPFCERLTCEAPSKLLNGQIIGTSFKFGDKVSYECDKGYNLKGSNILTCDGNQKWSGDKPSCDIIYCKKPKGPSNGKVRVNGLFYGATIMILCDPGFRLEGESKLQCQEDGLWNKEMPFCAPLVCPAAPNSPNSYYNSTEVYFESFTYLKYSCETGYKPTSENTILKCSAFGNWSGDITGCQPVDCGNPGALTNGHIEGNQYTFGNVIDFSCNIGFELIGEVKATCQENGQWSKKPSCQKITCNSPKQVLNGVIQASGVVGEFGSSITYSCHSGYVLKGSAKRSCEKNRKWSGTLPSCLPVSCPEPNELFNADITGDTYTFMKNITYTCHPGFIMKGLAALTCLETGDWSSDFPVCEIISCFEPTSILNGKWETKKLSDIPLKAEAMTSKSGKKKGNTKQGKGKHEKSKTHKASRLTSLLTEQFENVLYRSGHIIEYSCEDGYLRSGNNLLECTENGWNSPPPKCNPVTCSFPTPVKNGRVIGNEVIYGSVLTYECNEGFEIFGVSTRSCQANKEWTDIEPLCRPKECPLPAQIHNGKTSHESLKYQSIVAYSCSPGFRLEGNPTRLCQSNERWSGSQPVCVEIFCDEPNEVPFAVRDIGHLKVGGIVRYTCMEGYQLKGKSSLNCQNDGTWDGQAPVCSQVDCGPPPTDSHLIISGDSTTYAAKVKYSCERGYRIEGDYWSTCLQSGLWSNMPPACNLVTCELPTTPEHGILHDHEGNSTDSQDPEGEFQTTFLKEEEQEEFLETINHENKSVIKPMKYSSLVLPSFRVDDEITYSCKPGWEAIGEVKLICSQDGSWSAQPPVCQRISCGTPKVPSHAKYTGDNYLYSDVISFSCEQGYVMRGHASIHCSESGEWSDNYPACEPLSCGPPSVLPHSFVSYQTPEHGLDHHFGSVVTYFCEPGYQLEGSLYMTCSASFKWVGPRETPRCVEMTCDKPPLVTHANGVEEAGSKPQKVNYQCDSGYILSGNGVIECSLGKWSAINFTCNPVNCYEPKRPDNGIISAKHFMLGSVAEYSCIQGYILDGNPSVECSVEGIWTGDVPTCKPVNCGVPEGPLNGKVSYNSTLYTSSVSYVCDEGHELKGDVSRLCASDGNWSGHLPQCHRVSCGELRPPYRGYVIGVGQLYGDEVKFTCDKGYVLQGNDTLVCQSNGRWSESGQRCESVRCTPPGFILNGQPPIDLTKDYVYGDRISYTCDDGYIPRGDMSSVCQKGGTWSKVKGQCSLISCGRPKLNKDGAVILGRSFYYKDKIKIDCPAGTKPKGSTYLTCMSDGSWSGEASCISGCNKKCLNGGVCLSENLCSCPSGYVGKRCQHAVCILPCLNGGTCIAPYKCLCPEGYQGARCHMPLCPLPCLNGGVCTGPHKCTCLPGYAGTRCQTPVCEHSCGIHGRCIGPNVCLCKYGETGPTCPEYDDYEEETLQHETHFSDWDIAAFRRMRINKEQ